MPNTENKWRKIANDFEDILQFPHTLGCLDGKHIRIIKPKNQGSHFYCYKGFHSIILFSLVDAHGRFLFVDIGANGKQSDGAIFVNSYLKEAIENNSINFPQPDSLPGQIERTPYYIVADDTFGLSPNMMKPFSKKN